MKNKITVVEVKKLAQEYYFQGGDGVVECYEDFQIQDEINQGMTTPQDWIESFRTFQEVSRDLSAGGY